MTTEIQTATFRHSYTIGRSEPVGPGFRNPAALARGNGDRLYVVSRSGEWRPEAVRVTILTVEEELVGQFGRAADSLEQAAEGSFGWLTGIALDSEGNVYVGDEWFNQISMFTKDGEWIGRWGRSGSGDGEVDGPWGLAFDKGDYLYVVDSKNHRIQKFTKDGLFLGKWGSEGTGDGQFNLPWGIEIDGEENVYIADWRNDRIQKFTAGGQFLMKFGSSGTGDGQFNRPTSVAVDREGLIYVTDWGNDRLQVFDPQGEFITNITGDATLSKWGLDKLAANPDMWKQREIAQAMDEEKPFWGPVAVEVDEEDRIFVVEHARARVQVYRKIPPFFVGKYDNARL